MAYIGNVPAEKYTALTQQTFSTPTGTSFTLSQAVTNSVDIDLYIDNVKQDPASYSVSGTALTTSTIASPSTMYCIYNGRAMQTVNPPDDSVGLAQLAGGTDGNIISYDASGNPVAIATGSDGQVLTSAGAGAPPAFEAAAGITFGSPVAATSGTAIDFTSIPSGTKRITLLFHGVSLSASRICVVQLGDAGGFETSGYEAVASEIDTTVVNDHFTSHFALHTLNLSSGSTVFNGKMVFDLESTATRTWVYTGFAVRVTGTYPEMCMSLGTKDLTAELTQVRVLTSDGSATFDAGEINITYE